MELPFESRSYFDLIFAGHKMPVERGLHKRCKQFIAQNTVRPFHQLKVVLDQFKRGLVRQFSKFSHEIKQSVKNVPNRTNQGRLSRPNFRSRKPLNCLLNCPCHNTYYITPIRDHRHRHQCQPAACILILNVLIYYYLQFLLCMAIVVKWRFYSILKVILNQFRQKLTNFATTELYNSIKYAHF